MSGDISSLREGIKDYFEKQGQEVPLALQGDALFCKGDKLL